MRVLMCLLSLILIQVRPGLSCPENAAARGRFMPRAALYAYLINTIFFTVWKLGVSSR